MRVRIPLIYHRELRQIATGYGMTIKAVLKMLDQTQAHRNNYSGITYTPLIATTNTVQINSPFDYSRTQILVSGIKYTRLIKKPYVYRKVTRAVENRIIQVANELGCAVKNVFPYMDLLAKVPGAIGEQKIKPANNEWSTRTYKVRPLLVPDKMFRKTALLPYRTAEYPLAKVLATEHLAYDLLDRFNANLFSPNSRKRVFCVRGELGGVLTELHENFGIDTIEPLLTNKLPSPTSYQEVELTGEEKVSVTCTPQQLLEAQKNLQQFYTVLSDAYEQIQSPAQLTLTTEQINTLHEHWCCVAEHISPQQFLMDYLLGETKPVNRINKEHLPTQVIVEDWVRDEYLAME